MTGELIRASQTTAVRYERDRPGELGTWCQEVGPQQHFFLVDPRPPESRDILPGG
jgi:hypothetical protein